jgi:hypothetical protein
MCREGTHRKLEGPETDKDQTESAQLPLDCLLFQMDVV